LTVVRVAPSTRSSGAEPGQRRASCPILRNTLFEHRTSNHKRGACPGPPASVARAGWVAPLTPVAPPATDMPPLGRRQWISVIAASLPGGPWHLASPMTRIRGLPETPPVIRPDRAIGYSRTAPLIVPCTFRNRTPHIPQHPSGHPQRRRHTLPHPAHSRRDRGGHPADRTRAGAPPVIPEADKQHQRLIFGENKEVNGCFRDTEDMLRNGD
jgi:hypothetical protein